MRSVTDQLPQYDYLYLGDSARAPYGPRPPKLIYEFTREAVGFLFDNGCQLVVLACNTASSDALHKIQQEHLPRYYPDKKVLGVLIPAAEEAADKTKNKRVGVIATEGTVKSGSFVRELVKLDPDIKTFQRACPLLVPIIEAGEHTSAAAGAILAGYIRPLLAEHIDTLILGCTHYGLIEDSIVEIVGPDINIVSERKIIPGKLAAYLQRHPEIKLSKGGTVKFYSTDPTGRFGGLGSAFFGREIEVRSINGLNRPQNL